MGLQVAPGFVSGGGTFQHPVELFRNLVEGLTAGGQKGILTPSSFPMTPSGSLMQLTVGAGYAVIAGEESSTQGSYFVWSNAAEVLAWPAHPGSNSRWDTLILRVVDSQYGVDANPDGAMWEICQGTAAASPTKIPDVEFQSGGDFYRPGAWWRVADVLVQAADLNMAATDITAYMSMAVPYHQRGEAAYALQQTVYYTAAGTFTKANYPLARKVRVRVQAAGGSGAGGAAPSASQCTGGSGGGGGGYAEAWLDVASLSAGTTITVGFGGSATTGNGNGGGTSSFGSAVVATGGGGGFTRTTNAASFGQQGAQGGIGTAGDLLIRGGPGEGNWGDGLLFRGGAGGNSQMGGGGTTVNVTAGTQSNAGGAGGAFGGGGGGAAVSGTGAAANGGVGGNGLVVVEVYA